jgi:hypothetical protein
MRQKEGKFFFFFSIDCTLEWTTEYRGMKKQIERRRSDRIEEKKDDWGQHLRAGSKYRTTVHDGVREKRSEEKGQQEDRNDYQYATNNNVVR